MQCSAPASSPQVGAELESRDGRCPGWMMYWSKLKARASVETTTESEVRLPMRRFGTASLAADRPWLRALSIYGNDYWNNVPYRDVRERQHEDGPNHFSVPIIPSGGSDRRVLLDALEKNLGWILEAGRPDLLLYQAGADPLRDDPYSPLDLTHEDLMERDRIVFEFARKNHLPIAWVLAGGYTRDIEKIVEVHVNTARAWKFTLW